MPLLSPTKQTDLATMQDLFSLFESHLGFVPNSLKIMARRPQMLEAFAGFTYHVMAMSQLDESLKSLVCWAASAAHGCRYCQAHTFHAAKKSGMETQKITALPEFETSAYFTAAERAAMVFAQCMAHGSNMIAQAEKDALQQYYTEDEIFDIVSLVSYFGFLNRWNDTLETPIEAEPAKLADTHLPGWDAGKHGS
ncbi:hypothetical protein MNBD_ALPHA06-2163 [hydrothermal vent metagenome]|uniref:Carboxymuconolactone decarboxylase-like domain-containing protein n=1 Tax=hydrothermal vent metagenome TaxID=652676 RepID=A0A3B0RCV0_9ZZZZ